MLIAHLRCVSIDPIRSFKRVPVVRIVRKFAAGIVLCSSIAAAAPCQVTWGGFESPVRFATEAPVICFSQNKAINRKLRGVAVGTNSAGVSVYRGFANGAFQQRTDIAGGFAQTVAMDYLDADTIPDIVVPSYSGASFTVYRGTPDGGFVPAGTYQVEGHCTWVTTGDFNEDSIVDIAAAHNGSGQPLNLYIYTGNADGTFSRFQKYPTQLATPTEIIPARINADPHLDLSYSLSGPQAGALFLGNGDGTFGPPAVIADADSTGPNRDSEGFSLADIDSDGRIDWIGAEDFIDSIVVRRGDGTGKFVPWISLFLPHPFDVETTDLNGDGRIDIVASNFDSIVCYLQNPAGLFTPAAAIHSDHIVTRVLASDVNGDGVPDLVFASLDSSFSVAMNRGNSTTGVDRPDVLPSEDELFQNYPNPFNPSTVISFDIPKESFVSLDIYNALGQEIARLVNETRPAGRYSVTFDAGNLPSGLYVSRLTAGGFSATKKMVLVR